MNLAERVAYELQLLTSYTVVEPERAKQHRDQLMRLVDSLAALQADCEAERIGEQEARERLYPLQKERRELGIKLLSMKEVA